MAASAIDHADVVIDATGTYGSPNRLGDGGIEALSERAFEDRIDALPARSRGASRARWAGRTILLTGAGHSAQTAARELAAFARDAPGTRVVWAVRARRARTSAPSPTTRCPSARRSTRRPRELAGGASDAVDAPPRIASPRRCARRGERIARDAAQRRRRGLEVDRILALNGGVGDARCTASSRSTSATRRRADEPRRRAARRGAAATAWRSGSHGPETLRNPEPGFFILGAKSYGRNSQFLLRIGWQQVDDVFESLIEQGAS